MGTRWRGLLAPINQPTGDGRRMARGAFRHRPLPLPLKWQREDEMGHDSSVIIGLMDSLTIDEDAGEVWGEGELFDDQPQLPRLAEDVGEALLLTRKGVIGPSVDAGAASAILVEAGSDEPVSEERMEELFWEAVETGVDPDLELLFTDYEIAAATLVSIPAFVEARPFELLTPALTAAAEPQPATSPAVVAALTAAAAPTVYPAHLFALPDHVTDIQPITREEVGDGITRVYGYVAAAGTCHLQFRDMCVTPPTSTTDYALFHRYPLQLDTGELIGVGRLTTGHGKVGTGCGCCRGKDDHACDAADLSATVAHYDRLTTLAWVRAGEDERGHIWVAGVEVPGLSSADRKALGGGKFSGDWRDHAGNLEMVEVLALATDRPGFPLPSTTVRGGRQVSLTAAGGIPPRPAPAGVPLLPGRFRQTLADAVREAVEPVRAAFEQMASRLNADQLAQARQVADAHAAVTAAEGHTGAMVALRMSDPDAARLAVDGGEPAADLHVTVAYLGDAVDIDDTTRAAITSAVRTAVDGAGPVDADGFAVSAFNPGPGQPDTAVVLGVGGDGLADLHTRIITALGADPDSPAGSVAGYTLPEQHTPWVPHITLAYTDDLGLVETLTDRCGPVTFDRVRVAYGGQVTDITLTPDPGRQAADLGAQIDAALAASAAHARAHTARALIRELEVI